MADVKQIASLNHAQTMTLKEITDLLDVRHNDAMKVVEKMAEESSFGNVTKISYRTGRNNEYETYQLNKRQSMAAAAKLNTALLMRVIDRWQELESQARFQIPQTLSEALLLAGQLAADKESLEKQIEADKPKVEFAMAVRNLEGSCLVREFAKVLGTGQNRLYKDLRDAGYLMANNQPYQKYIDSGVFVVVEGTPFTDSSGKAHPTFTTRITGKGQVFLEKRFRQSVLSLVVNEAVSA